MLADDIHDLPKKENLSDKLEVDFVPKQSKRRMIVWGCLVVIVAAIGVGLWLSDFGYHTQPMYEAGTYDEFVGALEDVKNPCIIPSQSLLGSDASYVILLEDRFHNTPSGYGVSSADFKSSVECRWLEPEEAQSPLDPTGAYCDVEIAESTDDTGVHHIQFLLDGYLYTVGAPTADEAMALAQAIIDLK